MNILYILGTAVAFTIIGYQLRPGRSRETHRLLHSLIYKLNNMAQNILDELKAEAAKTRASLQKIREDIARIAGGIVPSGGLTEAEAKELKTDLQGLAGEAAGLDSENEPAEEPPAEPPV